MLLALTGCRSLSQDFQPSFGTKRELRSEEDKYYWGRATLLTLNQGAGDTEAAWSSTARYGKTREARCLATALLLGAFVRPGFNSQEVHEALPDAEWLDHCSVTDWGTSGGVGGQLIDLYEGLHFALEILPEAHETHSWYIHLTLSPRGHLSHDFLQALGQQAAPEPRAFLRGFLLGNYRQADLRISEFTLTYPWPGQAGGRVIERHSPRGVGIEIEPPDWYETE